MFNTVYPVQCIKINSRQPLQHCFALLVHTQYLADFHSIELLASGVKGAKGKL